MQIIIFFWCVRAVSLEEMTSFNNEYVNPSIPVPMLHLQVSLKGRKYLIMFMHVVTFLRFVIG